MANRIGEGAGASAVVMRVDITERKLAEQELNRLAYQDALTGLPSRNGFVHALSEQLGQTGWQPNAMVMMFDIRRHRDINDSYGYAIGDRLLQAIGERITEVAGEDAVVGRIGGDEFVIYLPDLGEALASRQRDRIARAFERPFAIDDLRIDAVARFGYTLLGSEQRATEELLREAELALFELTASEGGNDWCA
ncbi:MAG: GGDEF domain-containing protein, partial [Halofilum sp. (in: g-proteobacteria)]